MFLPLVALMDLGPVPDALVPRSAWSDRLILDANVSPPVSKEVHGESQTKLNGDFTTGYRGDRFGFQTRGESTYYSIDDDRSFSLTERYAGSFDAWALFDVHPSVRLEPRLAGGAIYYGTLADETTTTLSSQTNQDSIFARGVGSLGVRVQPGTRYSISASFGAGYQYEDYFRVAQTSRGAQTTVFDAASTVRYEGRVRAHVAVVPNVVAVRARGDFNSFAMHRSDVAVTFIAGQGARTSGGVTEIAQTEIFARGFVDLDAARFFGFVPAIHGGANVFLISSGSATSAVTPVFGIGIRREAL